MISPCCRLDGLRRVRFEVSRTCTVRARSATFAGVNNRLRTVGVVLAALLAAALVVRGCSPEPQRDSATAPARLQFDATQPLSLEVIAARNADGRRADIAWLQPELRRLLSASDLRLAPTGQAGAYQLRIALASDGKQASLALIAPDQVLEREQAMSFDDPSRLAVLQQIASAAAKFLNAPQRPKDWTELIGVSDPSAYDAFTRAASDILGPDARGFTRPPPSGVQTRGIERLELLVRSHPRFVRARGTLALGYLSLGGEDESSLTRLAAATAEKTLALDPDNAEAHAALGIALLRRNEWITARERFDSALALHADNAAALEGLACLLADAGLHTDAQVYAARAVVLLPRSEGSRECLAYVDDAAATAAPRVAALKLALRGEPSGAEALLKANLSPQEFGAWVRPVVRALASSKHKPEALRATTRAASDAQIDASTEILSGAMLRQADFVLNRMARLQRDEQPAPLRMLWLSEAPFLRRHPRFEDVVNAAGLPSYWQKYGAPDVCAREPKIYGCALGASKNR